MGRPSGMAGVAAAITLAGVVVGSQVVESTGTPVIRAGHALHADVILTSDTAIFVGGTLMPTPSPTFAQTAADLFLQPLGFDAGEDPMSCVVGTTDCDAPLQILYTPQLIQQGHSSFAGAYEIVRAVQAEFAAHPGEYDAENPLWVFGYSQGASAGSIAMAQLAADGNIDPDALHFVFIGDPLNDGDQSSDVGSASLTGSLDPLTLTGIQTPNDAFLTTVYAIPGDPVADHSADPFGLFYEHLMYVGLTPDEVAHHTTTTDGLITNIDISGDFEQFDAWLNAFGHGLLDSGWWESLFNSAVAFVYNLFGAMDDFFTDWLGIDWSDVEETLDVFFPMD